MIPIISVNIIDYFLDKKVNKIDERNAPKVAPNGKDARKLK